jgi:NAD(P)-dependent dehydrogenase (short-subunit alcohol dehydrogenase family)
MPRSPDYPELEAARPRWRYQPAPDCLEGRAILVTGAGAGLGRAAARTFAVHGADVLLLGRTRSKLEAVSDWITAHTSTAPVIVPCDLEALDDAAAETLLDAVADGFGRLDGILHNASLLGPKVPLAQYPSHAWHQVMRVNVFAPFLLTRALLPMLLKSEDASVVLTSSSVGRKGRAYWGAYAVSKFALEGLMQVLADEYEHTGRIRINTLNPGATRTAMRAAAYPGENPAEVPTPEARMDVHLYLFEAASRGLTGAALDARDWPGPPPAPKPGSEGSE